MHLSSQCDGSGGLIQISRWCNSLKMIILLLSASCLCHASDFGMAARAFGLCCCSYAHRQVRQLKRGLHDCSRQSGFGYGGQSVFCTNHRICQQTDEHTFHERRLAFLKAGRHQPPEPQQSIFCRGCIIVTTPACTNPMSLHIVNAGATETRASCLVPGIQWHTAQCSKPCWSVSAGWCCRSLLGRIR